MRKRKACEALSISTKQHRSNQGSPITLVWPGAMSFSTGHISSHRSIAGPRKIEATMDLSPNSFPTITTASTTSTTLSRSTQVDTLRAGIRALSTIAIPETVPMIILLGIRK